MFRDNASSRMRRHCIIRPKDDAEDEADADADAADGAATATASGAESAGAGAGGDGDSDEEGDAPRGGVPLTTEPGGGFSLMSGSDRAISQHIASTIVSQGHLCPLPLSVQPVYWAHDVGLRLFPLPDVVVLADDQDLFVREQVCGAETTVACPGSLAHGTFLAYEPAARAVIACDADAALAASQVGAGGSLGEASPAAHDHHEWQQSQLHASPADSELPGSTGEGAGGSRGGHGLEYSRARGSDDDDEDADVEPGTARATSAQDDDDAGDDDDVGRDDDDDAEPSSSSSTRRRQHSRSQRRTLLSPGEGSPSSSGSMGTPGPGVPMTGTASSPSGWVPQDAPSPSSSPAGTFAAAAASPPRRARPVSMFASPESNRGRPRPLPQSASSGGIVVASEGVVSELLRSRPAASLPAARMRSSRASSSSSSAAAGGGSAASEDDDDDDDGDDGLQTGVARRLPAHARAHIAASAGRATPRSGSPRDAGMALIDALQDDDDE